MQDPWLGEIALVAFNFAPPGWAFCNGQILSVAQNTALFSLLGPTYGGDGVNTFALPDLRSRVPLCFGQATGLSNYALGQNGGFEGIVMNIQQLPVHNHSYNPQASASGGASVSPANALWAESPDGATLYKAGASNTSMASQTIGNTGANQPHENRQPFLALNYIIALQGIFPSRN
jgi:microcystin-dependent protein